MISVFEAKDYKEFLKGWIEARPKGGRGESRRIAEKLGISTTLVSQILNGDKHFTMEAASDLCDHLGLSDREAEHFLLLVDYARAGSYRLKARIAERIKKSREAAMELAERFKNSRDLTPAEASVYYSHWSYTGITNWIATRPDASVDEIAARLRLPAPMVGRVLAFLIETGILINKGGHYEIGAKSTYTGPDSPLVVKHHQNWRIQGFNRMPYQDKKDFFFTSAMSLSEEVAERIRAELPNFIEKISAWVGPSPSEVVRCLNIDWFEY